MLGLQRGALRRCDGACIITASIPVQARLVLRHHGLIAQKRSEDEPLYQAVSQAPRTAMKAIELTFIPYYAWANRGNDAMEIWIPVDQAGNGRR